MMDIKFQEVKDAFATYYVWTEFDSGTVVFVKQILSSNREKAKENFQMFTDPHSNVKSIILFDKEGEALDCIPEGSMLIGLKPFEGLHVNLPEGVVEPVINSVWREMNKIPFYASDFVKAPNC